MKIVDGQGVDSNYIEVGGVDRFRHGDDVGVDRSIDHIILGYFAPKNSNFILILFLFRWENFMINFTQQDGDLAKGRVDGGSQVWSPPTC